jgi:hypothetical protein
MTTQEGLLNVEECNQFSVRFRLPSNHWVWIAASISSFFFFAGKPSGERAQGMVWSAVSLCVAVVAMIVLLAKRYFWDREQVIWAKPGNDATKQHDQNIAGDVITVSPKTVNLFAPKGSDALQEIFIHNSSDTAYFMVWVKVAINSPSINAENVRIKPPNWPLSEFADSVEKLHRVLFSSLPDSETNSFSFLIQRLGPRETKRFVLVRKDMDGLSNSDKHEAVLRVEKFTMEPPPVEAFQTAPIPTEDRPKIFLQDVRITEQSEEQKPTVEIELINIGTPALQVSAISTLIHGPLLPENYRPQNVPIHRVNMIPTGSGPYK